MHKNKRLIVGITGASGVIYGIRLLEILKELKIETHLVVTKAAEKTRELESTLTSKELYSLANVHYNISDIGAHIASGSYITSGMIVAPCSMKTLAEIANGTTSNLLSRAADVVLKERRRLVLMVRETPLHKGHIKNMLAATEMGAIINPPVPAFYRNPKTLDEMINHTLNRALNLFNLN